MQKFRILMSVVLCLPLSLVAQNSGAMSAGSENATRATVFGGYSYLRNGSKLSADCEVHTHLLT